MNRKSLPSEQQVILLRKRARGEVVDMLTAHRHGEDKEACGYCAAFYGDIVDRIFAHLDDGQP